MNVRRGGTGERHERRRDGRRSSGAGEFPRPVPAGVGTARPGFWGSGRDPPGGAGSLRVLVSFTPGYAAYGEAFSLRLRASRPLHAVALAPFAEVGEAVSRFRPHLVVSDGNVPAGGAATIRISAEPEEPSTIRAGERVCTVVNPSFEDLLRFVDEVERSVGEDR